MSKLEIFTLVVLGYIVATGAIALIISRAPARKTDPVADAEQMAAIATTRPVRSLSDKLQTGCDWPYCVCPFTVMVAGCGTRHAPPVIRQESTAPATGAPAAPLEAISPGGCSPVVLAAPPVALKKMLLIERCSDPHLWYAKKIGKKVPYIREYPGEGCYISREDAGFTNIVRMSDARIVIGEAE